MLPYLIVFIVVIILSFVSRRNYLLNALLIFILVIFIGLRYEVGCDWFNYLRIYEYDISIKKLFPPLKDFLYDTINYIAHKLDLNIYFVNFIVAIIIVTGVFFYTKTKKYFPYLLIYSTPYLFFVVAMGYTRQAMAIGFIFWSLFFLEKRKRILGYLSLLFAFLSHKTAIVILIFYLLFRQSLLTWVLLFISIAMIIFFYKEDISLAFQAYVVKQMSSKGFWFRYLEASIFIIPFLFLYQRERIKYEFLKPFMILYILVILLVVLTEATTVADRFFLYTYPLQLYSINYLMNKLREKWLLKITVIGMSFLTLIIWFKYAFHRHCWIPYQNILFK